jgi:hypothetical protein
VPVACGRILFFKRMKKVLQFVAIALVAILATQPALAGLTCGMKPSPSMSAAADCDMAMNQMGTSCPMHSHGAGTDCLQECCRNGWPQAVVQSASKAKPKAVSTQFILAAPSIASAGVAVSAAPPAEALAAAAPDRHVLLQVFRI